MSGYTWKPIDDLSENWQELSSIELQSLASIWKEQSVRLQQGNALRDFNEKLGREWAIETGIIENLYTIDRGTTRLLIEKGIEASLIPHGTTDRPAEQIVEILKDHEDVLEGLFDFVAQRRDLSTSYVKQLHQGLTKHQDTVDAINGLGRRVNVPLLRGDWKNLPNNPSKIRGSEEMHEYCPPEQVNSEMDRLIALHLEHIVKRVPPEVEAAWLHHRFTQIHPFQDGNGRVARALASIVFIREKWFPLVIHGDSQRDEYLTALEAADTVNLEPLVTLFSKVQKRAFLRALSLSENVLHEAAPLTAVISAATDRLRARKSAHLGQPETRVFEISSHIEDEAENKFRLVADQLNKELRTLDQSYVADSLRNDPDNDFWFRNGIVAVARYLDYYADTRTYRKWVRLRIIEDRQTDLVLSFHSLGVEFLGIVAVSAFMEFRDKPDEDAAMELCRLLNINRNQLPERPELPPGEEMPPGFDLNVNTVDPRVLSSEVFQFSHGEQEEFVAERFDRWLGNVILLGLDQWRKQL